MSLDKLESILASEPKYRLVQAKTAVFKNLVENWSEVSGFPPQLREKLNEACPLEIKGNVLQSDDGGETLKALITLSDGLKIESVLMCHEGDSDGKGKRNTVCVSCQVGGPMGCSFCATGAMGLRRNLAVMEIVQQVLFFDRILKKKNEHVSGIVFMGMGEPFLNYDNVLAAVRIFNDKDGLNIGARKISISTCGIIEGIKKMSEESLQVNLAISLHAPDTDLRSKLMPVNKKYSLNEVLNAVNDYIEKTSRRVMFEYLLIKDVNDTAEHARKLASIMHKPLYFVNLILFNPSGKEGMQPSSAASVKRFKEILEKAGVPVSQRYRFGRKIKAACGQLVFEA